MALLHVRWDTTETHTAEIEIDDFDDNMDVDDSILAEHETGASYVDTPDRMVAEYEVIREGNAPKVDAAELALAAVTTYVTDALARYAQANTDLHRFSLLASALLIRGQYPTATHLIVSPSDQGPYLTPDVIVDPECEFDDLEIEEYSEIQDRLWEYINNLDDEDPWGYWQPFVTVNPSPRHSVGRASEDPTGRVCSYALDLDLILFYEADAQSALASENKGATDG